MMHLILFLMALGALKAHFHCSSSLIASPIKLHQACGICATKHLKKNCTGYKKLDIIIPLGVDKTAEWSISFVLVSKANGEVRLCLDPLRLNQALMLCIAVLSNLPRFV